MVGSYRSFGTSLVCPEMAVTTILRCVTLSRLEALLRKNKFLCRKWEKLSKITNISSQAGCRLFCQLSVTEDWGRSVAPALSGRVNDTVSGSDCVTCYPRIKSVPVTGRGVAQRVGRCIALLFHDRGTRRGWVVSSTLRP